MDKKVIFCCVLLLALTLAAGAQKNVSYSQYNAKASAEGSQSVSAYAGGDLSQLPIYENAGSVYVDASGNTVADFIPFCRDNGWNTVRLRLFVNPDNYNQADKDSNACQDLEMIKALGKRVKDAGMIFMLDFHYSDTWADPSNQWTPKDWETLSDDELAAQIYSYTKDVLQQLVSAGAAPDLIQTGNEISYGMCWGAYGTSFNRCYVNSSGNEWTRFASLLKNAVQACREILPEAKIIIHTERVAQPSVLTAFYDKMASFGVDYDVIGLSYYPYFHGSLDALSTALDKLSSFEREIMIVEAGYPLYWAVPGTTYDYTSVYPYSDAGQKAFTDDLIALLKANSQVTGFLWWEPEYNPYVSNLSGWYNAPLIEPYTGKPTSAFYEIKNFLPDDAESTDIALPAINAVSRQAFYNLSGQRVGSPESKGVYVKNGKKIIVK